MTDGPQEPDDLDFTGDSRLDWGGRSYQRQRYSSESHRSSRSKPRSGSKSRSRSKSSRRVRKLTRRLPHPLDRWARRLLRPRTLLWLIPLVIVALIVSFFGALWLDLSGVRREPLLTPAATVAGGSGTNILLVGSQANAAMPDPATLVVELVHVAGDGGSAEVIDFPRDLALPGGTPQQQMQAGGTKAVAAAVAGAMQVGLTHIVQVDFRAYANVTDDIGGVQVQTATGGQKMTGSEANAYANDSTLHPIDVGRRHQQWVKAMLTSTLKPGVLLNPFTVLSITDHATSDIVADDTLSANAMVGLAWKWKGLGPGSIHFFTVPNAGYVGGQLKPDTQAMGQLGAALRSDNGATIGVFTGH